MCSRKSPSTNSPGPFEKLKRNGICILQSTVLEINKMTFSVFINSHGCFHGSPSPEDTNSKLYEVCAIFHLESLFMHPMVSSVDGAIWVLYTNLNFENSFMPL